MNKFKSLLCSASALAIITLGANDVAQAQEKIHWPWERLNNRSTLIQRVTPTHRKAPKHEREPTTSTRSEHEYSESEASAQGSSSYGSSSQGSSSQGYSSQGSSSQGYPSQGS